MIWEVAVKYFSVAIASTLKFLGGPITGFILNLNFFETIISSSVGMMFTVVILNFLGQWVRNIIDKRRKGPRKRFTKTNRIAINIWRKFGVAGIALLTPPLFTPPIGASLMVAFRAPKLQVFIWMFVSSLVWGVIFTSLVYKLTFIHKWLGI